MPIVWIPSPLRDLTNHQETAEVSGTTLEEIILQLEQQFPGIRNRLLEKGQLRPGLAVIVGNQMARLGLDQPIPADAEVHFIPAIGGG